MMNARADSGEKRQSGIGLLLAGLFLAVFTSILLTLWAHILIAGGMHPETIYTVDFLAPLLGLFLGAAWAGRRSQPGWSIGLAIAIMHVVPWFVGWSFLVSRFEPKLWWREAVCGLTIMHISAWLLTLIVGTSGGWLGERFKYAIRWLTPAILVALPLAIQLGLALRGETTSDANVPLSAGVTLHNYPPSADGTQVRLMTFDFIREPRLECGVYEADFEMRQDDRNTVWLGHGIEIEALKLQRRLGHQWYSLRCLINGGFFGWDNQWVANHEAPIVIGGQRYYHTNTLAEDWPEQAWTFGVTPRQNDKRFHFRLLPKTDWEQFTQFRTAIGGVRPLIVDGHSLELKPGIGNTKLRCSRTSLAWDADSSHLYILSVRDPDGEAASIYQKNHGLHQNGGWDVRQVQEFWEKMKVPTAVLFDGGESTQMAYGGYGDYRTVRSAYHLSHTFGYWRDRPIRCYLPMLPVAQNTGGVLNYFYVYGPYKEPYHAS